MTSAETPLISVDRVVKQYPGVLALNSVSMTFESGRIHALVGENGAGKSTLIKILSGVIQPDSGEIRVSGTPTTIRTPVRARDLGITTVHQHSHLLPTLTVAENHALRRGYPHRGGMLAWSRIRSRAHDTLAASPVKTTPVDETRNAGDLSVVEKQVVEIAYALGANPAMLILDEPTAVLPHVEADQLFEALRVYARNGGCVLFVSHRLEEVFSIADDVTVMRDGGFVWRKPAVETNADDVIEAMVGRAVHSGTPGERAKESRCALEVKSISDAEHKFTSVNMQVRAGEVYGLYGLVGAGQEELCHALFGLRPISEGQVALNSAPLGEASPGDRVARGLAYVPSDRLAQGVFSQLSVGDNLSVSALKRYTHAGLLSVAQETHANDESIKQMAVRTTGQQQNILNLSGGNQQKVLFGRWLQTSPRVLILHEPTQGVDVGAKGEIHRLVREMAQSGAAVLLVTSEIPELLSLCHRIGVIREGRIVAEMEHADASQEEILRLALPDRASKRVEIQRTASPLFAALRRILAMREAGLAILIAVAMIVMGMLNPAFRSPANLRDIMLNNTILLIGALGASVVIISGGIDISVGAMLALAAAAAGNADEAHWPPIAIALAAISTGLVLGAINGGLTLFGRVHPIIITLGTFSIFRGALIQIMGGRWIFNLSPRVTNFAQTSIAGIPILLVFGAGAFAAVHWFLRYTVRGRRLYAYGADAADSSYLGIYARHVVPLAFAISGLLIGLAGLLHAARFGQVQTNAGMGFELKAIAAAVIGGTHIAGGRGSAFGTLLGALFMGLVSNVIVLTHITPYLENIVIGALILATAGADMVISRMRKEK